MHAGAVCIILSLYNSGLFRPACASSPRVWSGALAFGPLVSTPFQGGRYEMMKLVVVTNSYQQVKRADILGAMVNILLLRPAW